MSRSIAQLTELSSLKQLATITGQDMRALYSRSSQRLDHLPCALVTSVGQEMKIVPLPGPRGVLGYAVGSRGNVYKSQKRRIGPYLAASSGAKEILKEVSWFEEHHNSSSKQEYTTERRLLGLRRPRIFTSVHGMRNHNHNRSYGSWR